MISSLSYASTVFKAYNGRVKTWYVDSRVNLFITHDNNDRYTFNEPRVYCAQIAGYPFSEYYSVKNSVSYGE